MNPEIMKRLDVLAEKLGVTAQYLWGVLIKQARVEAIEDTLLFVVFAVVAYIGIKFFMDGFKEKYNEDSNLGAMLAGGSIGTIAFVVSVCSFVDAITEWFNPAYFALHKVLEVIGK